MAFIEVHELEKWLLGVIGAETLKIHQPWYADSWRMSKLSINAFVASAAEDLPVGRSLWGDSGGDLIAVDSKVD
ncbi:unnamed protein product [Cochlearia groenlandica]